MLLSFISAQGKDSTIKLPNTSNVECVIPIPTRIMNALSKHVYLFLVAKISKSMRMLHKTECNKYDGFTLIQRILTLERESLHTPLEVLNKRERDTTIDKLNDWNTFEPDFVDLMDAFDEAEKLKRIDSKDNKSLRAWKDLLIEKTHHLFDSKLIEYVCNESHENCSVADVLAHARALVRAEAKHLQLTKSAAQSSLSAAKSRLAHLTGWGCWYDNYMIHI